MDILLDDLLIDIDMLLESIPDILFDMLPIFIDLDLLMDMLPIFIDFIEGDIFDFRLINPLVLPRS